VLQRAHPQFQLQHHPRAGIKQSLFHARPFLRPQHTRFISRDPSGLAGGTNMYEYAGDSPVAVSDPMGTNFESALEGPGDVCSGCIGGFVGAYAYQGLAPLANMPGIDNDVPLFYDGSQNSGGEGDPSTIRGAVSASFVYDALGRRVRKTINGTTTRFLYDGSNPDQELAGDSPPASVTANLLTDPMPWLIRSGLFVSFGTGLF
jgi:RHS repeat-associated protein